MFEIMQFLIVGIMFYIFDISFIVILSFTLTHIYFSLAFSFLLLLFFIIIIIIICVMGLSYPEIKFILSYLILKGI